MSVFCLFFACILICIYFFFYCWLQIALLHYLCCQRHSHISILSGYRFMYVCADFCVSNFLAHYFFKVKIDAIFSFFFSNTILFTCTNCFSFFHERMILLIKIVFVILCLLSVSLCVTFLLILFVK